MKFLVPLLLPLTSWYIAAQLLITPLSESEVETQSTCKNHKISAKQKRVLGKRDTRRPPPVDGRLLVCIGGDVVDMITVMMNQAAARRPNTTATILNSEILRNTNDMADLFRQDPSVSGVQAVFLV